MLVLGFSFSTLGRAQGPSLQSYAGQTLILRYFGGQKAVSFRKDDFEKHKGECDVAVEVKRVSFSHEKLKLKLETVGDLAVRGRAVKCTELSQDIALNISGFAGGETEESVTRFVQQFLQTPDAYLATYGVKPVIPDPEGDSTAIGLPRTGVTKPEVLLNVFPFYRRGLRISYVQGIVTATFEVGTDGRIHSPRIKNSPDRKLSEAVLRVLPLLRFQPARQGGKPIRVRLGFEASFRVQ